MLRLISTNIILFLTFICAISQFLLVHIPTNMNGLIEYRHILSGYENTDKIVACQN
jgi:hypothetical protein